MKHRLILISRWHLDCDIHEAWQRIHAIQHWPQWWPNVRRVQLEGEAGDTPRAGSVAWVDWRTRLGYGLRLRVTTISVLAPFELEGAADGDLSGRGLWVLQSQGEQGRDGVIVTYRWDVHLNRPWMRLFAPLLRPVFAWNHFDVMRTGARAMALAIGCRLLRYQDHRFAPGSAADDLRALRWPEPLA
jgi:hypothetical protein